MRKNVRNGFPKSKYHFFLDCPFLFLLKYRSCKNQIENTSKTINVTCPLSDGRARLLSFFVGKNQTGLLQRTQNQKTEEQKMPKT